MPCFPSLSDLPEPPDAVVVAIPAAGVAAVVEEAGAIGCGGAVVYGAGFGEIAQGTALERELAEAARRHGLPVCGPNGNGIVALHERVALWGDALRPLEPGRVALVSQSGNVAVNTLATRRGLRLHTVISCGNSAALDPADWIAQLAREEGVGSIAVYLEADGDGARLCAGAGRVRRARRGRVGAQGRLLAGRRARGGGAHRRRGRRPARVPRARGGGRRGLGRGRARAARAGEGAGRPGRAPAEPASGGGLAVLTCSGGDSALAADYCARNGLDLPPLAPGHRHAAPRAAARRRHGRQPARLHGADLGRGGDPAGHRGRGGRGPRDRPGAWCSTTSPSGIDGRAGESLGRGARGHPRRRRGQPGAGDGGLHAPRAARRRRRPRASPTPGYPRSPACAPAWCARAALRRPAADPARLRAIAAAAAGGANGGRRSPSTRPRSCCARPGVPVVEGRLAAGEEDAAGAMEDLGPALVLKLSAPTLMHKSELRALALDLRSPEDVRAAYRRLVALGVESAAVLVERMEPPGARAARVRPPRRRGARAGGRASAACGRRSTTTWPWCRCRPRPSGWRRRCARCAARPSSPAPAAARRSTWAPRPGSAAAVGDLLLAEGLGLIELNPVLVHEHGALAVDALAG